MIKKRYYVVTHIWPCPCYNHQTADAPREIYSTKGWQHWGVEHDWPGRKHVKTKVWKKFTMDEIFYLFIICLYNNRTKLWWMDTLKKLLRVLFRIILTPSICCGNTSGDKQSKAVRSKAFTGTNCTLIICFFPSSDSKWFQKCSWTEACSLYRTNKMSFASIQLYSQLHGHILRPSFFTHIVSLTYLCNSCGESESCLGWVSGHLSSPTVADCPSEQDVRPSEREGGPWRKASSDGLDQKTKPKRCPCGDNTFYKMLRDKGEHTITLWHIYLTCSLCLHYLKHLFMKRTEAHAA